MTNCSRGFGNTSGWGACCLIVTIMAAPGRLLAQLPIETTKPGSERLLLRDQSLRSSVQGARIDRQVEIGRLEGRIDKLEKLVRGLPQPMNNAGLITLVLALDEGQTPPADLPGPAEEQQPFSEDTTKALRTEVLQLVAQDYMATLKREILEARIVLFEETQQLASLERLATKGLASRPQLELQQLKLQSAQAHYSRMEQQQTGLAKLFPTFYSVPSDPPAEEVLPTDQP